MSAESTPRAPDTVAPAPAPAVPLAGEPSHGRGRADGHGHSAGNTHCLNCGTPLHGAYCHACGQHDFDSNRSFRHTLLEALENFFHFEGKFFRNIVTLLFRPGRLTADFNAGKRASQMPPFRLYVFTAFVFFLWAFSTDRRSDLVRVGGGNPGPAPAAAQAPVPSDGADGDASRNRPRLTLVPIGKPAEQMSATERWLDRQMQRIADPEAREEIGDAFIAAIPKLLLIGLPLFALYTRFLFRGTGQLYLQHLIMALHFHTFIFLWLMFRDGWVSLFNLPGGKLGDRVKVLLDAWAVLYPLLMLRHLHRQSWPRTIGKTLVLALAYCCTLPALFFAAFVVILAAM